jgi:hypothetical protein
VVIKYYTVTYREDFASVKQHIKHDFGSWKRLQRVGEFQSLMGNHKIQEFRVALAPSIIVKIDGPGFILIEFLKELGI